MKKMQWVRLELKENKRAIKGVLSDASDHLKTRLGSKNGDMKDEVKNGEDINNGRVTTGTNKKTKTKAISNNNDGHDSNKNIDCDLTFCSRMLLKRGDDIRKDLAVMNTFALINYIWSQEQPALKLNYKSKDYKVERELYRVIPISKDFGCIEFVENCHRLEDVDKVLGTRKKESPTAVNYDLITSGAACFVSSFIIGARDRHIDNILLHKGRIFDVDFNFIFDEKSNSMIDASRIAISSKFKNFLGKDGWKLFIEISLLAYQVLREHYIELLYFMIAAFESMKTRNEIEEYLRRALRPDEKKEIAIMYMKDKLEDSPGKFTTKVNKLLKTGHF